MAAITPLPTSSHPSFRPLSSIYSSSSQLATFTIPHLDITRKRRRIRCSVAEGPAAVSPPPGASDGSYGSLLDCVVVGGGIGGLCVAQALSTKHRNSNLMVTEARERVGGNITTVERDGYLWEEGPNSFQPSDPMLTMAVSPSPFLFILFILIAFVEN